MHDHDTHSTQSHRLAQMRRAGYRGPAYLRGRPGYEYIPRAGRGR